MSDLDGRSEEIGGSKVEVDDNLVDIHQIEVARLVNEDLIEDAVGDLGDIPPFDHENDVRKYLNMKAEEYRQSEGLRREGPTRRSKSILATLYEKLASGSIGELVVFAQMQGIKCERRLSDLKGKLDLLQLSIDVIERVRNLGSSANAARTFNAGFLEEANGPIFVDKVLGPDFVVSVEAKTDVVEKETGGVRKALDKWRRVVELFKADLPGNTLSVEVGN